MHLHKILEERNKMLERIRELDSMYTDVALQHLCRKVLHITSITRLQRVGITDAYEVHLNICMVIYVESYGEAYFFSPEGNKIDVSFYWEVLTQEIATHKLPVATHPFTL